MKKNIFILCMGLLICSTSCSDFLTEDPIKNISSNEYFGSESALKIYATGFINKYAPSAATLTRGDQYTDISITVQAEAYLRVGYNANDSSNWATSNWAQLYNVNFFLTNMTSAKGKVDDDIYNHYEGVGRFCRAWFYWTKVKTFGDVPWYD